MNTFEYASGTVATMRKSAKGATQPRKKVRLMVEGMVGYITMRYIQGVRTSVDGEESEDVSGRVEGI